MICKLSYIHMLRKRNLPITTSFGLNAQSKELCDYALERGKVLRFEYEMSPTASCVKGSRGQAKEMVGQLRCCKAGNLSLIPRTQVKGEREPMTQSSVLASTWLAGWLVHRGTQTHHILKRES